MLIGRDNIHAHLPHVTISDQHSYSRNSIMIQLSVNGESRSIAPGANLARLLEDLSLTGKRVAVERNGEIVPRSRYAETLLANGDQLEIVVAVGGG